jgi:sec-independent protein translocase protein TatB
MFDLTSSKLLLLGIVALLVVGPRDLPLLLRTIGKYIGMIRHKANEFRALFEEAIRESELEQLKNDVESVGRKTQESLRQAESSVEAEISGAKADVDEAITTADAPRNLSITADAPIEDGSGWTAASDAGEERDHAGARATRNRELRPWQANCPTQKVRPEASQCTT